MRRPGSLSSVTPQSLLEQLARRIDRDVAIARELVRERAHVAGALHVVLAAQRVHADAAPADIAGRHGEVGDRHHRGGALAVLGDAEAVVDRAVAAGGVEPGGAADRSRPARRRCFATASGLFCGSETNSAQCWNSSQSQRSRMNFSLNRPSVTMTCASAVTHRDIGAGQQRQMIGRLDVRRPHHLGAARVDDDQLGALRAAASSCARRTPDARRPDWRR